MTDGISDIAYGVLYIIYRQVVIYAARAQKKYNCQSNRNFLPNPDSITAEYCLSIALRVEMGSPTSIF
jgi:hypothetical protein